MAGKPRRTRATAWMRVLEQNTRNRDPEGAREARRLFKTLGAERQQALAQEISDTRASELCRAYPNVISVGYGYGLRANEKTKRGWSRREPCVVLVVRDKWPYGHENTDEAIPRWLYTYAQVGRKRRLVGVPTDVVDGRAEGTGGAQSKQPKLYVKPKSSADMETGVVTCAVQRDSFPNMRFAVSVRHFLGAFNAIGPNSGKNYQVRAKPSGPWVARTRNVWGVLDEDAPSCDMQLAYVPNPAALKAVLGNLKFAGALRRTNPLPKRCLVLTPDGPVPVLPFSVRQLVVGYNLPGLRHATHEELILSFFASERKTVRGHSGSPVVTATDPPVLVGMHLGMRKRPRRTSSNPNARPFQMTVPAWFILDPRRYAPGPHRSERWRLVKG